MTVVIYILLLSMVIYAGMLLWFQTGNLFYKKKVNSQETPPVSIIVAIRNGENSLPQLFTDFLYRIIPVRWKLFWWMMSRMILPRH